MLTKIRKIPLYEKFKNFRNLCYLLLNDYHEKHKTYHLFFYLTIMNKHTSELTFQIACLLEQKQSFI